ncbi:C2 domain containing protein, partial [Parasponia andersonii]
MATVEKLIVEVVDARNLSPKDGHGTSSPYVTADYYGQRKRTQTVIRDLNPTWNKVLEFNAGKPSEVFEDVLEINVFHDKNHGPTTRNNFLGRLRLNSAQFVKKGEEALVYLPLEKKHLFSFIQGDIGLKIYYADEVVPPPPEESNSAATEEKAAPSPSTEPPPAEPPSESAKPMEEPPAGQPEEAAPAHELPPANEEDGNQ